MTHFWVELGNKVKFQAGNSREKFRGGGEAGPQEVSKRR